MPEGSAASDWEHMLGEEVPLPEFLRPLFWEVDWERLCVRGHERYIIERVLEYGDLLAVKWMLRRFFEAEVRRLMHPLLGPSY